MKVQGKITIADVSEGVSRNTGNEWKKVSYCIRYSGHYANGTACERTLAFNIFGRDRLNALKIMLGQEGELEFETRGDVKTASSGTKYETNEIDVIGWTPTKQSEPAPEKPVAKPVDKKEETPELPF